MLRRATCQFNGEDLHNLALFVARFEANRSSRESSTRSVVQESWHVTRRSPPAHVEHMGRGLVVLETDIF